MGSDVRFEVTEFTIIGAHCMVRGEVCQVINMITKYYILKVETNMDQRKCMEAFKGKAVFSINLAQLKKVKYLSGR